jgi:nitroimidazol reductase NimA-like FMN-containing flavoprotein (pyridoxamine 5'-phosphate oxidase superfamily)
MFLLVAVKQKSGRREELPMKAMSDEEVRNFIEEWTWGTIIAVDGDKPYAIEVSYGSDGKHIYCGSRPDGIMSKCIMLTSIIPHGGQ